tara:strand:+ start:168060 stop:170204 length:2145 start_codon:yes stop_codon:yes gene_type:complete
MALAAAVALTAPGIKAQGKLEEILVTAQKREELLRDVPISISVVQGATVEDFSIQDFEELQAYVPNLFINDTPANNSAFIRGIGTSGNVLAFESSVALFVDGIYAGRNRAFHNPYLDLQRVEVLRGPQGALFGRNTAAGAISVVTQRPTEEFFASVQGEYEFEYESYNITGILSGPVSDTLRLRLATKYADNEGYVENTELDRMEPSNKEWQIRVGAEWQPTDSINAFFKAEMSENDITGMPFELVLDGGDPDYKKDSDDGFDPIVDESENQNFLAHIDFALGEHTLTSITGYSAFEYNNSFNIQATGPARLVTYGEEDFDQFSQELRLLSPAGQTFEYIVGAYYGDEQSDIFRRSTTDVPFTPARPEGITLRSYEQSTETLSLFAQGSWNVTDKLKATAGIRWTDVKKDGDLERDVIGFAPGALNTPLSASQSKDNYDPSFNVTYDLTDNVRIYASYATGSKGGGFNGASSDLVGEAYEYGPEKSENIELGIKASWDSVYVNFVLFDTDYEDLQQSSLDITTAGAGSFITTNAAEANSKGVEMEAGWAPTEWLQLSASAAYLDAEYTDYPGAKCPFGDPGFNTRNCATNIAGFPLTNAPEWSGSLVASVNVPVTDQLNMVGGFTATYQDDIFYQPSYNPLEEQEAYWLTNARIGIAQSDNDWSVTLLVKNLFDEEYSSLIYETFPLWLNNPAEDRVHLPGRPRTVHLQARYNF